MEIRLATVADIKDIARLHSSSWQVSYKGYLNSEYLANKVPEERLFFWKERIETPSSGQQILVAEVDNKLVGFACVYLDKDLKWGSYLDNLHVDQKQLSRGIGKSLLRAVADLCAVEAKNRGLCLLVTQFNINAQRFYKRLGAVNQEESTWLAPDGTLIPTYWFIWDSFESINNS